MGHDTCDLRRRRHVAKYHRYYVNAMPEPKAAACSRASSGQIAYSSIVRSTTHGNPEDITRLRQQCCTAGAVMGWSRTLHDSRTFVPVEPMAVTISFSVVPEEDFAVAMLNANFPSGLMALWHTVKVGVSASHWSVHGWLVNMMWMTTTPCSEQTEVFA